MKEAAEMLEEFGVDYEMKILGKMGMWHS
jgi:phosphoribosylcarboxyaminoimidazole (NCAIR) mutase